MNLDRELFLALAERTRTMGHDLAGGRPALLVLLQEWQTLATGILALLAAGLHAWMVQRQIRVHERLATEQRDRRFAACRAVLPLSLSAINYYCRDWAPILDSYYNAVRSQARALPTAPLAVPNLPAEVVRHLQDLIECADPLPAQAIRSLLSHAQVVHARLKTMVSAGRHFSNASLLITPPQVTGLIIDLATLHAESARLFDFARGAEIRSKELPSKQEIEVSLKLLGYDELRHAPVFEALQSGERPHLPA